MPRAFTLYIAGNVTAINPLHVKRVEGTGSDKKKSCKVILTDKDVFVPEESFEKVVEQWNDALKG